MYDFLKLKFYLIKIEATNPYGKNMSEFTPNDVSDDPWRKKTYICLNTSDASLRSLIMLYHFGYKILYTQRKICSYWNYTTKHYVIHERNFDQYLTHDMELKSLHRALEYTHSPLFSSSFTLTQYLVQKMQCYSRRATTNILQIPE